LIHFYAFCFICFVSISVRSLVGFHFFFKVLLPCSPLL
jgi:hypothetical protein